MTPIVRVADLLRTVTISVAMVSSCVAAPKAANTADREPNRVLGQLLIGGMPDEFDPTDPSAPGNAAFEGHGDGLLRIVSCGDGKTLANKRLDAPPVWDGMAVAHRRLFLVDRRGRVLCMGEND